MKVNNKESYASEIFSYMLINAHNSITEATFNQIILFTGLSKKAVSIGLKDLFENNIIEKVSTSKYKILIKELPDSIKTYKKKSKYTHFDFSK